MGLLVGRSGELVFDHMSSASSILEMCHKEATGKKQRHIYKSIYYTI